jgi:hypothetical protein
VPLHQYVYFALSSRHTSAAEMTAFLGIEPDETTIQGSRSIKPRTIPVAHAWKIICREPGLRVDEQVARIIGRLAPHTERIAALVQRLNAEGDGHSAVLEIVRYFNEDEDDLAGRATAVPAWRTSTADYPNMFGWHLDRGILDFLSATDAALDVDEYDMTPPDSLHD